MVLNLKTQEIKNYNSHFTQLFKQKIYKVL